MRHLNLLAYLLLVSLRFADCATASTTSVSSGGNGAGTSTTTSFDADLTEVPTDSLATYPAQDITSTVATNSAASNATGTIQSMNQTSTTSTTSSALETELRGTGTASASSYPSGGVRCNGYEELCNRKYSNVTYVVAHNSPFHVANNAASNQDFDVTTQLDNGVRGIQSETHYYQKEMYLCHTSCDELNAGTLEAYLATVKQWLDRNRYEVITILLGNEDFVAPENYTAPFTNAGLVDMLYIPPTEPMDIDSWPTLAEMIISNRRVVIMLAYNADQSKVPWLLDFWSYQWQTPFSPTNPAFPCTVQRPPGQKREVSERRLYLANHNLNVQIPLSFGSHGDILVPDVVQLNSTNANTTVYGSAELAVQNCTEEWGRPPNYLLVDYYNRGNFNGSTLATAARANGVPYYNSSCCGDGDTLSDRSMATTCQPAWLVAISVAFASLLYVVVAR